MIHFLWLGQIFRLKNLRNANLGASERPRIFTSGKLHLPQVISFGNERVNEAWLADGTVDSDMRTGIMISKCALMEAKIFVERRIYIEVETDFSCSFALRLGFWGWGSFDPFIGPGTCNTPVEAGCICGPSRCSVHCRVRIGARRQVYRQRCSCGVDGRQDRGNQVRNCGVPR